MRGNFTAILAVSFGTSYNDSRDVTIGAIEKAIAGAFPEYEVRRAFTSQIIIDILRERDSLEIDNVQQALDRAAADGIKELIVQPTHLMNGLEYQDIVETLADYADRFDKILLAAPLLTSDADFKAVIQAIAKDTASYDDGDTAICFMGHGTEAKANAVYDKMQEMLVQAGYENYYIGTVEAVPTLDDVVRMLKEKPYKKALLQPLMVVAGDHANNDMAGEEEDSWKTILENEGYEVACVLKGLGQIEAIQDIYVEHIRDAVREGKVFTGTERSEEKENQVSLQPGTYSVKVESDSSMFKVAKAQLIVAEDGSMTVVITMSGTGYDRLYMKTGKEEVPAKEEEYIFYDQDSDGAYTFTFPVPVLDQPVNCAAYSKKRETWYDRQLVFQSSSLRAEK